MVWAYGKKVLEAKLQGWAAVLERSSAFNRGLPFLCQILAVFSLAAYYLMVFQVEIQCGETSELVEATEPAKCEYYFVFRTPAACVDPDRDQSQHMEL